jgi:putative adhesin
MTRLETRGEIEHEIGPTGLLAVRLRAGDARLRAVEGSVVRIHDAVGDLEGRLHLERGEGSLSVRSSEAGIFDDGMHPGSLDEELVIDVPTGATVVVEASSADVTIDGLLGDQRYRTASGDIRLRDVSGQLSVETVSGDIEMLAVDRSSVAVRTVSGDVSIRASDLDSLRATTTSGDVRLAGRLLGPGPFAIDTVSGDMLLALAGHVRLEASTVAGDVTSEVKARSEGSPGRRVLIVGDGRPTMTVRSMSGDVSLTEASAVTRPFAPTPPSDDDQAGDSPTVVVDHAEPDVDDAARLAILRALEAGQIDVAEATRRLEALEGSPIAEGPSDD